MEKEKLLKLANFIGKLKPHKLNMDIVASPSGGNPSWGDEPNPQDMNFKCTSAACAMGWTPSVFPRSLKWKRDGNYLKVTFGRRRNWPAMAAFFNIPVKHARALFRDGGSETYETPKQVSAGLREYAKTGKVPKCCHWNVQYDCDASD